MSTVYIASSLRNRERVRHLRDRLLVEYGINLSYDWTEHGQIDDDEQLVEIAAREAVGVIRAKCVLVVQPARAGSHFEMGLAFGLRIPIVLLWEQPNYVSFYRRPEIIKFGHEDAALAAVADIISSDFAYQTHLLDDHA